MADWQPPVECPKCGSTDTRFVEPHYEMSVYECNVCGRKFEAEEEWHRERFGVLFFVTLVVYILKNSKDAQVETMCLKMFL